ncbi:MAG: dihydropteroate synthase [Lachnospiraceae bacterium]|nr:dihydropteroate synthase [Lachnospiraceae bacterium]
MIIGDKDFNLDGHTYVMGILNVTPDSFSDGGRWNDVDKALFKAEEMIKDGAAIIDVGGESTRPGYEKISDEEEIERTVPVIAAIKERFDTVVSVDTYKSAVAAACADAGVDLINDIWGLKYDGTMAKVIAEKNLACCLMHNRKQPEYDSYVKGVINDLKESVDLALDAGIHKERIILDPGVGFAKTPEQNLEIMAHSEALKVLGFPILLGTSRKSVIGYVLDTPVNERLEGTLATTVMAVMQGYAFVRVHDVKENVRAIKMTEAVLKYNK